MESIGVRELRQNASRYLDRVKRGESIEVTERGVPIAVLGPLPVEKKSPYQELVDEGRVIPAKGSLGDWLRENPPLPADPGYAGPTATQTLIESREEERF